MMTSPGQRGPRRLDDERGAVAVLFALTLIVLFAAVAFTIDISRLYHARQVLQNAVDFGALAGAAELPAADAAKGAAAEALARSVAIANAPQLASTATLTVSFRCIVGDRDQNNVPDAGEVPFICGPSAGTWAASTWTYKGSRASHTCDPYAGDKCNTIRLQTSESVDYFFAPVIGINDGNTGSVSASSCKGACGAATSPIDAVMVLDRTGSMTDSDIANVKSAALAVLDFYDPSQQWVGMVSLPYGQAANKCNAARNQFYPESNYTVWQNAPLSQDYKRADGTINAASNIVQQINCLTRAGSSGSVNAYSDGVGPSGNHTNLGDPVDAARDMLRLQGRDDVPDVIIFMTDGQANQPSTRLPCTYFNTKANVAKSEGQTIFTIAYGVDTVRCTDSSGAFRNVYATTNIASAASQPTIDDIPGGCGTNENRDGDWYFCAPASADLEPVFRQVAAAAIETSHLVDDF
jgi:hypothetical protein